MNNKTARFAWVGLFVLTGCDGIIGDTVGVVGGPAPADKVDTVQSTGAVTCVLSGAGAPVPMRRLTASQLAASVRDVLGIEVAFDISDEDLLGFRSNTTGIMDSSSARQLVLVAEAASKAFIRSTSACRGGCLAYLLDDIGPRLFRRPLDAATQDRYRSLYQEAFQEGGEQTAVEWTLQAMLQSPNFLYLIEQTDTEGRLDGYALAARLSYAFWGTTPDGQLFEAAEAGSLATDTGIREQVRRLMAHPRFDEGLHEFVAQWLKLERLLDVSARPDFHELSDATRDALVHEPSRFMAQLIREGRTIEDLLTTSETIHEPALADIYGDHVVASSNGKMQLDPTKRAGILTLPGVQAALSHAFETSPTSRGFAVLDRILCNPPPPPPPGLAVSIPEGTGNETKRERLELHFTDPTCASCHQSMDGIGFAFETYDWLGRGRTEEHGHPINTSGAFELGDAAVTIENAMGLMQSIASRTDVAECIASQWMKFATGVNGGPNSVCLMQRMAADARAEDGLRAMLFQYVTSDWFRRVSSLGGE